MRVIRVLLAAHGAAGHPRHCRTDPVRHPQGHGQLELLSPESGMAQPTCFHSGSVTLTSDFSPAGLGFHPIVHRFHSPNTAFVNRSEKLHKRRDREAVIESAPGRGTTIRSRFPLSVSATDEAE